MSLTTGIEITNLELESLARSFAYDVNFPDGTQTVIVLNLTGNESNLTQEAMPMEESAREEEFIGSMTFIAIVAGSSACCCCCLVILGVCRWRYRTQVDPDFEDPEEESDFDDDPEIEDVPLRGTQVVDG